MTSRPQDNASASPPFSRSVSDPPLSVPEDSGSAQGPPGYPTRAAASACAGGSPHAPERRRETWTPTRARPDAPHKRPDTLQATTATDPATPALQSTQRTVRVSCWSETKTPENPRHTAQIPPYNLEYSDDPHPQTPSPSRQASTGACPSPASIGPEEPQTPPGDASPHPNILPHMLDGGAPSVYSGLHPLNAPSFASFVCSCSCLSATKYGGWFFSATFWARGSRAPLPTHCTGTFLSPDQRSISVFLSRVCPFCPFPRGNAWECLLM
jgi:hypothetical protein